jgi:hypothetical protein
MQWERHCDFGSVAAAGFAAAAATVTSGAAADVGWLGRALL